MRGAVVGFLLAEPQANSVHLQLVGQLVLLEPVVNLVHSINFFDYRCPPHLFFLDIPLLR